MNDFKVNQKVTTPNGVGIVEGQMWEDGTQFIIIRHVMAEMTGREGGVCLTPRARIQGVWRYEVGEVKAA